MGRQAKTRKAKTTGRNDQAGSMRCALQLTPDGPPKESDCGIPHCAKREDHPPPISSTRDPTRGQQASFDRSAVIMGSCLVGRSSEGPPCQQTKIGRESEIDDGGKAATTIERKASPLHILGDPSSPPFPRIRRGPRRRGRKKERRSLFATNGQLAERMNVKRQRNHDGITDLAKCRSSLPI